MRYTLDISVAYTTVLADRPKGEKWLLKISFCFPGLKHICYCQKLNDAIKLLTVQHLGFFLTLLSIQFFIEVLQLPSITHPHWHLQVRNARPVSLFPWNYMMRINSRTFAAQATGNGEDLEPTLQDSLTSNWDISESSHKCIHWSRSDKSGSGFTTNLAPFWSRVP